MHRTILTALTALTLAPPAGAQTLGSVQTDIGPVLVSQASGMTLYTFDQDTRNQSNCYDGCAASWPPFLAGDSATAEGGLGIIERNDGTRQWALNGRPLYFWQGDARIGDVTGQGVGGVWFAAQN